MKNDNNCIAISNEVINLTEKRVEGEVNLKINISNPCIAFKNLDDNRTKYLNFKKCTDHIIFNKVELNKDTGIGEYTI